ncbi:MAG TPA: M15 family metallopeptidase [Polyangiaceae bacterium]|nr:M15 family metallopeptidase [Polyangiaceae bacterium]
MEKRWAFRHLRDDVRILTRAAASPLDRASAEHPDIAVRIARQLFERLRSESERRITLLAMTDLARFDAQRCSTAALQHNVLERLARKRDLLLVHDKDADDQCCPSGRGEFQAVPRAEGLRAEGLSAEVSRSLPRPPVSTIGAARELPSPLALATATAVPPRPHPIESNVKGKPVSWAGDSSRWSLDEKLLSMHSGFRPKVTSVLEALSRRGYQPKVHFAWRSVAVQLELVERGHSRVKFSFHNAQLRDGTPNAYAADVVDSRYGWSNQAKLSGFWQALGEEARAQNLYWGGDWKTFRDWAHIQLVPNSMLARVRKESGF